MIFKVEYDVYSTMYMIKKVLLQLNTFHVLGFDVETRSIYTVDEVAEAKALLKHPELVSAEDLILIKGFISYLLINKGDGILSKVSLYK